MYTFIITSWVKYKKGRQKSRENIATCTYLKAETKLQQIFCFLLWQTLFENMFIGERLTAKFAVVLIEIEYIKQLVIFLIVYFVLFWQIMFDSSKFIGQIVHSVLSYKHRTSNNKGNMERKKKTREKEKREREKDTMVKKSASNVNRQISRTNHEMMIIILSTFAWLLYYLHRFSHFLIRWTL